MNGKAITELTSDKIDLARIIRKGDAVLWGQGTAEPLTLSTALVAQRAEIGGVELFIGPSYSQTLKPEHADYIKFTSYCGIGNNQALAKADVLDILPCHYSKLCGMVANGTIKCDVVFLHLSAENDSGELSLGLANDYLLAAARRARVVIAEINDRLPWTYGAGELNEIRIDHIVRTSRPPLDLPSAAIGEIERRIAAHAARFIGDGAVLETGIGSIPDAVLGSLSDRKNLGIHSGMIADSVVDLVESGAVTNASKRIDRGITIAGLLFGTQKLYRHAHLNSALRLCPASYTHNAVVLSQHDNFIAINSAIEVDLSGQVNGEVLGGNYVGAVGGQVDFTRAAGLSAGGRSIIALPSTAKNHTLSRVVAGLAAGAVTTPRSDADVIVTEWGAAELRGCTLRERAKRMIAIAHPAHRERLEEAARKGVA